MASVAARATHNITKVSKDSICLVKGQGVEGDAHLGTTVKHRSRVAKDPTQPNLRQVHLIPVELHEALLAKGFVVVPAMMGENILTRGVDLLALPTGALLSIGTSAVVEITGLRNPCHQLNGLAPGLMEAVLERTADGNLIRKAGVMGIVVAGGVVKPGDAIGIILPPLPHIPLQPV
ncbi:MAG: MOSC domain-containing protein [Chakrabartia sp.]